MIIKGRLAVVTGASSGIGEATSIALAKMGCRVALLARSKDRLEKVAAGVTSQGGEAYPFPVDLSDAGAVTEAAKSILSEAGTPDILVNNAGSGRWLCVEETGADDVLSMIAVPYLAAFNITRELLPDMKKRGSGHIVNVTSVASRLAWPGAAGYAASRWAMNGFTGALRTELKSSGVGVSLATFGEVSSTFWEHNPRSRERLPRISKYFPSITSEQAAESIVRAVESGCREVVRPRVYRVVFALAALFPRTTDYILRVGWKG